LNKANPSLDQLYTAINTQLNCRPHYATGHDWKLVWGPVEATNSDNLVYAAFNQSTGTLAISIRGTTTQTWSRFEDVPRYTSPFPGATGTGARVSGPFLVGLKTMLSTADKWQGLTLAQFYTQFTKHTTVNEVVVNGHSQGAALVPMMMLALQSAQIGAPKVNEPIKGFAYAPPTSGNQSFASLVNKGCDCWFVINPKDVVPLGYNAMMDVLTKGIPEQLSGIEYAAVDATIKALNLYVDPSEWAQPSQRATLIAETIIGEGFFKQIGDQHNHNAYLTKLGVMGTDVGTPSTFSITKPPVVHT